ncbi:NAD(P)/FAD-dependent oxidoreductase [Desulfococcaceae bacterium HSG9]|nr:NAD(P)/FAD-dependent oxidoreductase [Desulfococcaceae bacterium HSG9]
MKKKNIVVIGAGPAGLTAADEAVKQNMAPLVLERADKVGGIARTESYKGCYFDVGGHRFFTKFEKIATLWQDLMGEDFLKVPRQSSIYFNNRFYNYPLRPLNALFNLGIRESCMVMFSFAGSKIRPFPKEETFEEWVSNRFGQRLYKIFFKTYTEKVWGIPCKQIRADWAAQRIKGLSLTTTIYNALFGFQHSKTLIDEFDYPIKGPGMMWERLLETTKEGGGKVSLNSEVISLNHENGRITDATYTHQGKRYKIAVEHLVSSAPITALVTMLKPQAPKEVIEASRGLSYRAFIIVIFIIDKPSLFSEQWIYIHSPNVRVGRIQNFKNWSAAMVPDSNLTSVGMEYFCSEGDDLWTMPETELVGLAARELAELGLAETDDIADEFVLRQPKAYPVYNQNYLNCLGIIQEFIAGFKNLQTIGRNGMHRYNNMDHSMLTGMMAIQNITGCDHNLWLVNEEEEYLEDEKNKKKLQQLIPERLLIGLFGRMDKLGFATAIGTISALYVFIATLWMSIKSIPPGIPNLTFLGEYFAGYTMTVNGAFIAFPYTFFYGFLLGWMFAYIRNFIITLYLFYVRKKSEFLSIKDFMEFFR